MNGSSKNRPSGKPLVLVFPFDLMAHYLRCIAFAEKFAAHYDFRFADATGYKDLVQNAGFATFPCAGFDAGKVMLCARQFDFSWLDYHDIKRVFQAQVGAIRKYKPAMVMGDVSPTLKMASEYTGVGYAAITNGYMTPYYARTRRLPASHPAHKFLEKLPQSIADKTTQFAEAIAFRAVHVPFKKIRKEFRLRPVRGYLQEMEADLNIVCDLPDLFPQKKLPDNYVISGPLLHNADKPETELLNALDPQKQTILVCMGSSGDWKRLACLASSQFSDLNIVTAGDSEGTIKAAHVFGRPFLDLDAVLPKCSALVCHGGNGTLYHGLKHGISMLCATSHFEQEWNVVRLEELGYAQRLNCSVDSLREQIDKAASKRFPGIDLSESSGQHWKKVRLLFHALAEGNRSISY